MLKFDLQQNFDVIDKHVDGNRQQNHTEEFAKDENQILA